MLRRETRAGENLGGCVECLPSREVVYGWTNINSEAPYQNLSSEIGSCISPALGALLSHHLLSIPP